MAVKYLGCVVGGFDAKRRLISLPCPTNKEYPNNEEAHFKDCEWSDADENELCLYCMRLRVWMDGKIAVAVAPVHKITIRMSKKCIRK